MENSTDASLYFSNTSSEPSVVEHDSPRVVLPLSITYCIIFMAGVLGNISTCVVISRNRSMHTATNFYLFSLAISDLILLICGLPLELYRMWNPSTYPLGEGHCVAIGVASETAANATVLTITAFTVERYIAICRPFVSHTISNLSRIIRFIVIIWVCAAIAAVPQAMQFGLIIGSKNGQNTSTCTVKGEGVHHVFISSSLIFFVIPMTIISVLYALIGMKLRTSSVLKGKKPSVESQERNATGTPNTSRYKSTRAQRRVIRMLIAVTLSFFICWAPFHVQRLLAMLGKKLHPTPPHFYTAYVALTWLSGILYYLSTAINPILYSVMSNKFRNAFKATFAGCCRRKTHMRRSYSAVQAFRAQRAACPAEQHPRRLHRLNTASTQLDAPSRAQFFVGDEEYSLEEPSPYMNTWRKKRRYSSDSQDDSVATISNSSLREVADELTGEEMVVFLHHVNVELGLT